MARLYASLVQDTARAVGDQTPAEMALDPMPMQDSTASDQAKDAGSSGETASLCWKEIPIPDRQPGWSPPSAVLNLAFPEPLKRTASTSDVPPTEEASRAISDAILQSSAAVTQRGDTHMTDSDTAQHEDDPAGRATNRQMVDRENEEDPDTLSEMDEAELDELKKEYFREGIHASSRARRARLIGPTETMVNVASNTTDASSDPKHPAFAQPDEKHQQHAGTNAALATIASLNQDPAVDSPTNNTPEMQVEDVDSKPASLQPGENSKSRPRTSERELKGLGDFLGLPVTRPLEPEEQLYDMKGRPVRKRRAPASRDYADFVKDVSDSANSGVVEETPAKDDAPPVTRPRKRLKTVSTTPKAKLVVQMECTPRAEAAQAAEPTVSTADRGVWLAMVAQFAYPPVRAARRGPTMPAMEPFTLAPKSARKPAAKTGMKMPAVPALPPSPPVTPSDEIMPPPATLASPKKKPPPKDRIETARPGRSTSTAVLETPTETEAMYKFDIDEGLLRLSRALTYRDPLESKPAPIGNPEVWADSRQALCETVPYFKKPQGGCHQNDRHVYSFLYDSSAHCRDYSDPELIIARAGGGMESDSASGGMLQGKDQSMSESQVRAVLNDMQLENPLIVISGDRNANAVCKLPHKYCVLGWYKPTMVWAEKTTGKGDKAWVTIKYRLEWLSDQSAPADGPWHARKDPSAIDKSQAGELVFRSCDTCEQRHPQIYLQSWLCLNPTCPAFWKLEDGTSAPSGVLDYNPAFLLHRTPWACEKEPYSVRPPLPTIGQAIGDNLTYENTRGVVCPKCGRCNQRYKWAGWHCASLGCDWEGLRPQHLAVVPKALHTPWDMFGDGPALARHKHAAGVDVSVRHIAGYKVTTYTFEGVEGRLVHAAANNRVNGVKWGADEMFADIQTADMGLERRRFGGGEKVVSGKDEKAAVGQDVRAPTTPERTRVASFPTPPAEAHSETQPAPDALIREEGLTEQAIGVAPVLPLKAEDGDFMTAFSMNYGMPYKFVASGSSKPFEESPWAVQACRTRLNKAAKAFLGEEGGVHDDFNEELIFAYMEKQKIEYHDDGEEGLGPRIATLSLGGKAQMHMRMKAKHSAGCSKTGLLTADRPVKGGFMYEERLAVWSDLQQLRETDRAAYNRRIKEIPRELGLFERRNKKPDDLVTLTLSHGDIVLMDGYDMQRYLEHKVVPEGYLRFALTCRNVLERHLRDHEKPSYEVKPDEGLYDGWDT